MGKKGGITSIFSRLAVDSHTAGGSASPPWPWPSCREPQTASFRADDRPCTTAAGGTRCGPLDARHRRLPGEMCKTLNSVYFDSHDASSCLAEEEGDTEVLDDDSFSTTTASEEWSEAVIRTLSRTTSTDRFFFDMQGPATNSNSILETSSASPARTPPAKEEEEKTAELSDKEKLPPPYKALMEEESVAVAVYSEDPHRDFRASMEEMVAAHGLRGWDALEELLVWYLRVNERHHHPLIVGAFVDLLVGLSTSPSAAAADTATTTTSSSSTSSGSASTSSSMSTSTTTTTTSTGGGGFCRTATAAATEQCGGGNEVSACGSSSSGVTSDQDEVGEKASGCNIRRS